MDKEELLSQRIDDENMGFSGAKPRLCMTCINANGEPPWADTPLKSYCMAYPREEGLRKPPDVYYEGADCKYYLEQKWQA